MKPMLFDMTRCYGHDCDRREECYRYSTMRVDPDRPLWYTSTAMEDGSCDSFIPLPGMEGK
jgi:hypothetical protein